MPVTRYDVMSFADVLEITGSGGTKVGRTTEARGGGTTNRVQNNLKEIEGGRRGT